MTSPAASGDRSPIPAGWTRVAITCLEDLRPAVQGADLAVVQMSRAPITGSLAFASEDGVVYSSGWIGGRVTLVGSLSERMITVGTGLDFAPGTRHWLREVGAGEVGVFLAGDEHDAYYPPGALYATATLPIERLEERAARADLVLERRTLGGSGIANGRIAEAVLADLRARFAFVHRGGQHTSASPRNLGASLLDVLVEHLGREPRQRFGPSSARGLVPVVDRARVFIEAHLDQPLSIDVIATGIGTSRRTLQRAFAHVLDEPVQAYVRRLRLHRIRRDLASAAEARCTIATVANRWGMGELGRLAGRYRELFGELPSDTLARRGERTTVASARALVALAHSAYPRVVR